MPVNGKEDSLRVLQISHDYAGPFQNICRQFSQAFSHAHVTTVYLRGQESSAVVKATGGDRVVFFDQKEGSLRGLKIGALIKLARIFTACRYEVVIAHRYKSIYLAGLMSYFFPIGILLGVAHEHDVFRRTTRALFVTKWRKNIRILAVSDSVRKDIERCCPSLAVQGRIHTVANAIDPDIRAGFRNRHEIRRDLGIPEGTFCFATVGRLVAKKDHRLLITAYARIAAATNCLVIVGTGPKKKELQSLVNDLAIKGNVFFTGNIPDAYRIYGAFDAFVLTSGSKEAFGIVLLEAMLAEVPIVCSNAQGPVEVVADAAMTFESGNPDHLSHQLKAVEMLDDASRKTMTDRGMERLLNNYTMEAFKKKLHDLPALKEYGGLL